MTACCIYNRNKLIKKFIISQYDDDTLYKDGLFINDKFITVFFIIEI